MKISELKKIIKETIREIMISRAELDSGVMKAVNVEENEEEDLKEMTTTGNIAGYSTPNWVSKNKKGSNKGIEAAKKYGKVVKDISEQENLKDN